MKAEERKKYNEYKNVVKMFTNMYLSVYLTWADKLVINVDQTGIEVSENNPIPDVFYATDAVEALAKIGNMTYYYKISEDKIIARIF